MACGWYHALAVTENNAIYAFGTNEFGNLGVESISKSNVPLNITKNFDFGLEKIISIGCGYHHSVVATDISLYTFGSNTSG